MQTHAYMQTHTKYTAFELPQNAHTQNAHTHTHALTHTHTHKVHTHTHKMHTQNA